MSYPRLVADIGGTNARFALCRERDAAVTDIKVLPCADFETIDAAVAHYLETVTAEVRNACLAIACAIKPGVLQLTNNHWRIDPEAMQRQFNWQRCRLLNDFEAIALALPHLSNSDVMTIGGGTPMPGEPMTVIGPGTGLGTAQLFSETGGFRAQASEGGHVGIAPASARELAVFNYWLTRGETINRELFLSGPGIVNLYRALCEIESQPPEAFGAATIQRRGVNNEDPICAEAMSMFCALLGSAAGDQALAAGARGGVFLAGGILPKFPDYLRNSAFRERFEAKGKMRAYVAAIPTRLITNAYCGLLGAARAVLD